MEEIEAFVPGVGAPAGVRARFSLVAYQLGMEILARAADGLEELGLSGRDYTTLAVLADDQPGSQLELARCLGKAPAGLVATVDGLQDRGLVRRERDPRDRRRSVVTLTPAGRRMLARADRLAERVEAEVLADLEADERTALHDTLRRVLAPRAAVPASA